MGWHLTTGPLVGKWVAQQINGSYQPGGEAIGLFRDGIGIIAGVLYEQYNRRSIVAHIAIHGRVTPAFIAAIFDYPFNVCGVNKVICPIPADNKRSIALAENMGFQEEARIRDAQPTGDILLFTLPKTQCRFLGEKFSGKIRSIPAARA